ncbi:TetR/AcrR family transcriptional regulator [Antiquaquibacter oligotrophicus]|nr:TetR/AcrR family transcriptional regulator [Antiquaquibacter oligotrophicus]UDF12270.1 TetR/AcrR family transcriptional regulator [Antiquaquibacter oligotrophicus]
MNATAGQAARREGDQLRGELLAAAAALASGPHPVAIPSLRAVARACSVSAAAVYRHFPSQHALMHAVLQEEYGRFERVVLAQDDPNGSPRARLRALSLAYVRWGLDNPGMYQLLFESADQLPPEAAFHSASTELYDRMFALIDALDLSIRTAHRTPRDVAVDRLAIGLHGIVSLAIHKAGTRWTVPIEELVEDFLPAS